MSWTPWQLAQFAATLDPPRAARPWKLSAYVSRRPPGIPYFSLIPSASWQLEQVRDTEATLTREAGSRAARMECSPWQSVQTGDLVTPWTMAVPWMLSR